MFTIITSCPSLLGLTMKQYADWEPALEALLNTILKLGGELLPALSDTTDTTVYFKAYDNKIYHAKVIEIWE